MRRSAKTLWVEMHTCPALANPLATVAAATLSMSASDMTISGLLEPSSIVTFLMPALRQMRSPISMLPVKVIFRTLGSPVRTSPIWLPGPVTHWMASSGRPDSSRISTSFSADRGVSPAGLSTTELPAARAGPTLWQTRFKGKLKGAMAATTPTGTRMVKPNWLTLPGAASRGTVSPCSRLAFLGGQGDGLDGPLHLAPALGDYLPFLQRDGAAQVFQALGHQVGGPLQDGVALIGGEPGHDFRAPDGAGNRQVDVGGAPLRHGVDNRLVERIEHRDGLVPVYPISIKIHPHGPMTPNS